MTTKHKVFTIPNMMSLFRLFLIPFIMHVYLSQQHYLLATALVVLSALTDIFDGIVARKFNMVSELGKVFDPLADKMTQLALLCCVVVRYPQIKILLICFLIKEIIQISIMTYLSKNGSPVISARWFGKACTACLYTSFMILFVFPTVPGIVVTLIVVLCSALLCFALFGYFRIAYGYIREVQNNQSQV